MNFNIIQQIKVNSRLKCANRNIISNNLAIVISDTFSSITLPSKGSLINDTMLAPS